MSLRIGHGYDVHQLKEGLPLIIGGESISFSKGILAHSDGDILIHTIIDALLGSTNLGDIGTLFPNQERWKNAAGTSMLQITYEHICKKYPNFNIINIDSTIILQEPKIGQYKTKMKNNIAEILNIDINAISIKGTTTDYLGFVGTGLGIAAEAVCLVEI